MNKKHYTLILIFIVVVTGYFLNSHLYRESVFNASYTTLLPIRRSIILNVYDTVQGIIAYHKIAKQFKKYPYYSDEKLTLMVTWVFENIRNQNLSPSPVIGDHFFNVLRRGYGYCDQDAQSFDIIATLQGYKVHSLSLYDIRSKQSPHTLNEIYWKNKWIVVDPWKNVIFKDAQGNYMSKTDIVTHPEILLKYQYGDCHRAETFRDSFLLYPFPLLSLERIRQKLLTSMPKESLSIKHKNSGNNPYFMPLQSNIDTSKIISNNLDEDKVVKNNLIVYNKARMLDIRNKYYLAYNTYNKLKVLNDQIYNENVMYYKALSLLKNGNRREAKLIFADFKARFPESRWLPSIKYFLP